MKKHVLVLTLMAVALIAGYAVAQEQMAEQPAVVVMNAVETENTMGMGEVVNAAVNAVEMKEEGTATEEKAETKTEEAVEVNAVK